MKRRDFCKGLAVTLAAGALAPAAALPQAGAATALVGRAVPDDYYTLWYRSDRCGADLRHDYYYSDSLFDHPATEYDNQLALATLGMAAAADCTWESDQRYWMEGEVGRADHIRDAFAKLGFTEVQLFNYTHSLNDTPDTVGCAIARKTLVRGGRQVTIIGAFLRGSGYGAEWSGNLHAGTGSAHTGFVTAARQLVEKIRGYVQASEKRQPLGILKLWMGGFSRGGGVNDEGFLRKKEIIDRAIERYRPDPSDPVDVLSKVGGFDLCGMTGAFLAAAHHRIPVVIDGFISVVAALCAAKMQPASVCTMIPSHASMERGYSRAMDALGLKPMLLLDMRLGEGSGCPIAFEIVSAAMDVLENMATFAEAAIDDGYLQEIRDNERFQS